VAASFPATPHVLRLEQARFHNFISCGFYPWSSSLSVSTGLFTCRGEFASQIFVPSQEEFPWIEPKARNSMEPQMTQLEPIQKIAVTKILVRSFTCEVRARNSNFGRPCSSVKSAVSAAKFKLDADRMHDSRD
jgi:hypothetical protein